MKRILHFSKRRMALWVASLWLCVSSLAWAQEAAQAVGPRVEDFPGKGTVLPRAMAGAPMALSAAAQRVYAQTRTSLLQIRTVVVSAQQQSSIGSGFLVSADGLALTNYHVVSQYALEPETYRMEYVRTDGTRGNLALLAIDVAHDLAVVRLADANAEHAFLGFDEEAIAGALQRGQHLYAMGNPLDLGFTIIEGTYNGRVEYSYDPRIHFTGALNPGMSGGPTVTEAGYIAGVNVAKRRDGELTSFLVPAQYAKALLEQAQTQPALDLSRAREEIGKQLLRWQDHFYQAVLKEGFRPIRFGTWLAPQNQADWIQCWAQTNAGEQNPKPRAQIGRTVCNTQSEVFISSRLYVGGAELGYTHVRSQDLNRFQFASLLSRQYAPGQGGHRSGMTPAQCHENFVQRHPDAPTVLAVWCARAYRDFEGLFDVRLTATTQDRPLEALISTLELSGISYANAVQLTQLFLEDIAWAQ